MDGDNIPKNTWLNFVVGMNEDVSCRNHSVIIRDNAEAIGTGSPQLKSRFTNILNTTFNDEACRLVFDDVLPGFVLAIRPDKVCVIQHVAQVGLWVLLGQR